MLSGEKVYDCDDQNDVLGSSEEVYINEAVATVGKMTKGLNHVACVGLGRYTTCEKPVRSCSAGEKLINPPICEQSYDLDKAALNGESEKNCGGIREILSSCLVAMHAIGRAICSPTRCLPVW